MVDQDRVSSQGVDTEKGLAVLFNPNISQESQKSCSAAQLCDWDVLTLIFSALDRRDLYSSALTCRTWSPVAYDMLYRHVNFHWEWEERDELLRRATILAQTLSDSAPVRSRVRYLGVRLGWSEDQPDLCLDWLLLLPSSILAFTVDVAGPLGHKAMDLICRADFLSSLKSFHHLSGTEFLEDTDGRWSSLLRRMPDLQKCVLSPLQNNLMVITPTFISPRLECLCIQTVKCTDLLAGIMRLVAPYLRILQFRFYSGLNRQALVDAERRKVFKGTLVPMPNLEQLAINYGGSPSVPLIDVFDFAAHFPRLRKVYFNADLDIPKLLHTLRRP